MMVRTVRRFPLHVHITTLFVLLIFCFGAVISWLQYRHSSELLFDASAKVFEQISEQVVWSFRESRHSAGTLLELLSLSPLTRADTLEARQGSLPQLALALEHNAQIAAFQVGYSSGDYFIVRKLDRPEDRQPFFAPEKTRFILDNIETERGTPQQVRLFFDAKLALLKRQEMGEVEYDPRARPWFQLAQLKRGLQVTEPYFFYFMRQLGVTMVRNAGDAVVSADITLNQLEQTLASFHITPSAELLLLTPKGEVLAYPNAPPALDTERRMRHVREFAHPVIDALGDRILETGELRLKVEGTTWVGQVKSLQLNNDLGARLVLLAPETELLAGAYQQQWRNLVLTLLLVFLMLPLTGYLASRIARPLRRLAREAELIQGFDFSERALPRSRVVEVAQLREAILQMKVTINRFLELTHALAAEPDLNKLQHQVVAQTREVSGADGAVLWLLDEASGQLQPSSGSLGGRPLSIELLPSLALTPENIAVLECEDNKQVCRKDYAGGYAQIFDAFETDQLQMQRLPLRNRSGEYLGVLCLFSVPVDAATDAVSETEIAQQQRFARELSGFAAITLESSQLLAAQKTLMQAFIQLLAGAIDAKSPYTGGHCQRVPELAKRLAQAACDSDQAGLSDFELDEQGWEALHIASWLHDCGKVTTPEYVVDKATKLETLYDRIHEVRTRFEVLKRDAELRYWQALSQQPSREAREQLKEALEAELETLDQEFAFIAECNQGGEFMAPEKLERLAQIGARTWQRTLDDQLGVSQEELVRHRGETKAQLPVTETLLADKLWHRIEHDSHSRIDTDNDWGFDMEVPEDKYNRGELYNLGVERGTLTFEERYRINDHIVQTIIMLEQLPFPKHLRQVPEIAGGHHEKVNGEGYPRKLTGEQMSVTARMIAIADVFEALTASDRPYKPAKKLSEALKIMKFMCLDGHLDVELFHLFLDRGIAESYAEHHLKPEQIDPIDPEAFKVS